MSLMLNSRTQYVKCTFFLLLTMLWMGARSMEESMLIGAEVLDNDILTNNCPDPNVLIEEAFKSFCVTTDENIYEDYSKEFQVILSQQRTIHTVFIGNKCNN